MEYPKYLALYYYLQKRTYPRNANETVKRRLRDQARRFEVYAGRVYYKADNEEELGYELLHEGNVDEVIRQVHEEGHFGIGNTYRRVRVQYNAPNLKQRVKELVQGCHVCQIRKRIPRKRNHVAKPIPIHATPFYMIGCDAVGPTQNVTKSGNRYLLVAVDYLTKWPMARAVARIDEETTAKFMFEEIVEKYGVPNYLLTDRGSNFKSQMVVNFLKGLGCRHLTTTAYRPQTNGCCERLNQTLVNTIAKLALDEDKMGEWDEFVTPALMAIRTMPNESTGYTPAKLLYGKEMRTPANWPMPRQDFVLGEETEAVVERVVAINDLLVQLRDDARNKAMREKERQKQLYDKTVHIRRRFAIGEKVLMRDPTPQSKFHARWLGPMVVTRSTPHGVYELAGPNRTKLKGAVNGDHLIPYIQHKKMVPDIQVRRAEQQFQAWIERIQDE
ncbi:hypothetical protein O0I10_012401 [Lichtheimia ornata]|uniref:Integrase catalytic domain-containing protein n=1 Tax=Lichtheimia ornata TaxID=688661 RepID=A0AAD7USP7_9FUNG|nr:uncharacterized protein O0I10_012401 [Lichtheimia ornata]KAJ8652004.1 hypothetical protein O0I10_012401 [Lichtheimia ornata]